ncbi:MAG: hypothetical protein ABFD98_02015 [Syntrophobacteraceae bacterium]
MDEDSGLMPDGLKPLAAEADKALRAGRAVVEFPVRSAMARSLEENTPCPFEGNGDFSKGK